MKKRTSPLMRTMEKLANVAKKICNGSLIAAATLDVYAIIAYTKTFFTTINSLSLREVAPVLYWFMLAMLFIAGIAFLVKVVANEIYSWNEKYLKKINSKNKKEHR